MILGVSRRGAPTIIEALETTAGDVSRLVYGGVRARGVSTAIVNETSTCLDE